MITEKEIRELIEQGYSLKVISNECKIPINELEQLQREIEIPQLVKKGYNIEIIAAEYGITVKEVLELGKKGEKTTKSKKPEPETRMQKLRKMYEKIYNSAEAKENQNSHRLTQEEIDNINKIINGIKKEIEKMKTNPKEKMKIVQSIKSEVKKLEKYHMPIEQSETLYDLVQFQNIKDIYKGMGEIEMLEIYRIRLFATRSFVEAIDREYQSMDDIESILELKNKVENIKSVKKMPLLQQLPGKINSKLYKLRQQKVKDEIINSVPNEVKKIVLDLSQGTLNVDEANKSINREVSKKALTKSNSKFALTQEQEKERIFTQIKRALKEQSKEYEIKDPKKTIKQLQELCNGDLASAIETVVENCINRGKLKMAQEICQEYYPKDRQSQLAIQLNKIRKRVKKAQIGKMVLKVLYMEGTEEEKEKKFKEIEEVLEKSNVKYSSIPLGKDKNGKRNITLEDICEDSVRIK